MNTTQNACVQTYVYQEDYDAIRAYCAQRRIKVSQYVRELVLKDAEAKRMYDLLPEPEEAAAEADTRAAADSPGARPTARPVVD